MNKYLEMKKLIGELEMMAAAAEPGVVITEEMSVSCCVTLLKAVNELKRRVYRKDSTQTAIV
ncbi:hypothetical protein A6E13_15805 [Aliivibrio fischeri]|uniref:hypothetical protein n=1 Tax=Aliivibrio fischeri TaxID=668 RepID=UPI00080D9D7C|nr:hypothetical protein [Aliivibrio fischeri]OCH31982.1 hypothetical protein A6E13_15805 [Aliivibrio fischeri]